MVFTNKDKKRCDFYVTEGFKETTWKEFLKICKRENSSGSENIRTHIERYVQMHRHGNPQTLMTKFGVQKKIVQKCEYPNCLATAVYEDTPKSPYAKPKVYYCKIHHERAKDKGLLRKSRKL